MIGLARRSRFRLKRVALFADECQSFLDNLIAGFGQTREWNDAIYAGWRLPKMMRRFTIELARREAGECLAYS